MEYQARLQEALTANAVITIVGTGVSKALTKGDPSADWVGLLRTGLDRVRVLDKGASAWADHQASALQLALDESDTQLLTGVATQLVGKLTQIGAQQAYTDWLRETVGALRVRDSDVGTALGSLRTPILTTNYDELLEEALSRKTVAWTDREGLREVFRATSTDIGHLHGIWKSLDSVILTDQDYARILSDEPAQVLEAAHYTSKSFLYVGYGDGLSDPNFGKLLAWHRKVFPTSRNDHFRLCLASEFDQLTQYHAQDDIRVISYGGSHSDLAPFLRSLRSEEHNSQKKVVIERDAVAYAREAIVDQIRSETVIGDSFENIEERDLSDITVHPVLLPMPHEQFVHARAMEEGLRPERINPETVHLEDKLLIVAGEELSGVTTALRWIVANAAAHRQRTAPLFVDARNCVISQKPLERQIKREAFQHGLIAGRNDAVRSYALAIDNLKPQTNKNYANLLADIKESEARFIAVGCREGDEGQVVEDLKASGRVIEIVYIGKLGRFEVQEFARILAPNQPAAICDGVMKVVQSERLPRTPFTIALLVVLLSQGASARLINNSETAVLEQYTNLLLGRSGPFLDPRHDLDPQNREVVLSELAKHFVKERRGAATEADVIAFISNYFISRDWSESASSTLESFRRMRLLRVEASKVQFQQTSYLHLFAAKAAVRDGGFLDQILLDPLYFAPIIRHYAALVRNSELVVSKMHDLLSSWELSTPQGNFYGPVDRRLVAAAPEEEVGEEPVASDVSADADVRSPANEQDSKDAVPPVPKDVAFDGSAYDDSSDADRVPFPLDDPASWPNQTRLAAGLELASRVLRDSDDLADLESKSGLFSLVISRWGYLAEVLEADRTFDDLSAEITDALLKEKFLGEDDAAHFKEFFSLSMAGFTLYRSLISTLASRKLIRTFERVRDTTGARDDPYSAIMLTLFALNVRTAGWAKELLVLEEKHGSSWSTSQFLAMVARMTHEYSALPEGDAADLRDFLKRAYQQRWVFPNERTRKIRVKEFEQTLLKERSQGLLGGRVPVPAKRPVVPRKS